jgi:4-diphosphocytidyl-2-C-methyl-D-erythritol kinase
MRAQAFAKLNLALAVGRRDESGYHPLRSLMQSIDWADELEIEPADEDAFTASGPVPADHSNLAWQAVAAIRTAVGSTVPIALRLAKEIPAAAGLGGGSADAAAALGLMGRHLGVDPVVLAELAPQLGSDVPFCLTGGLALVAGRGEVVTPMAEDIGGFAFGIVVPPFELSTAAVYAMWDALGEPVGPSVDGPDVPPSLRSMGPFRNDLYAAAVELAPGLEEWRQEIAQFWGRPVMLSGSGPALFSYFVDVDEAESAVRTVPTGARAARAIRPTLWGWREVDGTLS